MASLYFGGSFNPIHHAHLICSRAVAEQKGYERVVLVPSAQPPHKPDAANLADARDRHAMTQLAIGGDPLFLVNDLELQRSGPSYTIDTIRQLKERGEKQIHWLIGADMLLYLPYWHQPLQLLAEVEFIVLARPGWTLDWSLLPADFRHLQQNVVQAPLLAISSTDIRQRVAEGKPIDYLTPPAVCRYVRERGLYSKNDER
jgi:nicotinate-nucleotide adenylyltransferase